MSAHQPSTDKLGFVSASPDCIVEVAADSNAIVEALAEYGYRLFMEQGSLWETEFYRSFGNAKSRVLSKVFDEIKSKQGYVPPKGA